MNRRILIHENATLDLHEHSNYLAQNNRGSAFKRFVNIYNFPQYKFIYSSYNRDKITR
jgi:hypothetical protein